MISSDNPDLPTDIIHIKSFEKMSFRRQNPVLVWNCLVNFKGFLWSFGGRHSEKTVYKLDSTCHFQENRLKLPRGYISHECVVHNDYLYLCPDWDLSTTCTKLDYVSGKLLIGKKICFYNLLKLNQPMSSHSILSVSCRHLSPPNVDWWWLVARIWRPRL